jgi:hypothetical protein
MGPNDVVAALAFDLVECAEDPAPTMPDLNSDADDLAEDDATRPAPNELPGALDRGIPKGFSQWVMAEHLNAGVGATAHRVPLRPSQELVEAPRRSGRRP